MSIFSKANANAGLISVLLLIHSLNITRSAAILFFSWTVLNSSEMTSFASMLLIGELISMTLSASVGNRISKHGALKSFLLGESLFIIALGYYLIMTLSGAIPGFVHAALAYALMTFSSVISYPSIQTLLRLMSSNGFGTRNASLSNISSTAAYVIGPVLVGAVLTWSGAASALGVCLLFAVFSIALALSIGRRQPAATVVAGGGASSSQIGSPTNQIPLILMISIIYSAFTFLATYLAPLAIYQLKTDAGGLGFLRSAWSVGAIFGTIAIAVSASRREPGSRVLIASALLWAMGLSLVSYCGTISAALAALLIAGVLFALTRSTFDGLLLRTSSAVDYPKFKSRAQAGASAFSVIWILTALILPPLQIGFAFLIFAGLVVAGALLFYFSNQHSAQTLPKTSSPS